MLVCDNQTTEAANLGTQQHLQAGLAKAVSVQQQCDAIEPHRCEALVEDIRHVGVGVLRRADAVVDATDDASLAVSLTKTCNGLAKPLLRMAVDGSGQRQFGRVLFSHGGGGHACQTCGWSLSDLTRRARRTPCPGGGSDAPAPTRATAAIAMTVTGLALSNLLRWLAQQDAGVLDRETFIDLDGLQLLPQRLQRSDDCLLAHNPWEIESLNRDAGQTTALDLFRHAIRRLDGPIGSLEPYNHPLWTKAACAACRRSQPAVGGAWSPSPRCARCDGPAQWELGSELSYLTYHQASELGILRRPLAELGVPASGALFVARGLAGNASLRMLLA